MPSLRVKEAVANGNVVAKEVVSILRQTPSLS